MDPAVEIFLANACAFGGKLIILLNPLIDLSLRRVVIFDQFFVNLLDGIIGINRRTRRVIGPVNPVCLRFIIGQRVCGDCRAQESD